MNTSPKLRGPSPFSTFQQISSFSFRAKQLFLWLKFSKKIKKSAILKGDYGSSSLAPLLPSQNNSFLKPQTCVGDGPGEGGKGNKAQGKIRGQAKGGNEPQGSHPGRVQVGTTPRSHSVQGWGTERMERRAGQRQEIRGQRLVTYKGTDQIRH